MSELHDKARVLSGWVARDAIDDMFVNAIRALLAENERLHAEIDDLIEQTTVEQFALIKAEDRLRALCEQEPVAWLDESGDHVSLIEYGNRTIPLIPRPSMEDKS